MDHTGTLNMFMELTQFGMLTSLCKFTKCPSKLEHRNLIQTIGLDQDLDKLDYDDSRWICLDVPNGYTERFNDFVGLMEDMKSQQKTK